MNKNIHFLLLLFCCLVSFVSCTDETPSKADKRSSTFVYQRWYPLRFQLPIQCGTRRQDRNPSYPGVRRNGNVCQQQTIRSEKGDIIKHEIQKGTYDFVFLANEPYPENTSPLNGISFYSDLQSISYPVSAVNSSDEIPMSQEIKRR